MRNDLGLFDAGRKFFPQKFLPIDTDVAHVRDDGLDAGAFIARMRLEVRRAARSSRPLSLVLLRLEGDGVAPLRRAALWSVVCRRKRESDIAALIGHDLVGVLLPDTPEEGATIFLRDILKHKSMPAVSAIAQPYPGHLFANMLREDPFL